MKRLAWPCIAILATAACAQGPKPVEIRFTNSTGAPVQVTMSQTFCCSGLMSLEASGPFTDQWVVPADGAVIAKTACLPVSVSAGTVALRLETWQAEPNGAKGVFTYKVDIAPLTTETLAAVKWTNRTPTAGEGIPLMLGLAHRPAEKLVLPTRADDPSADHSFMRDEMAMYERAVAAAGGRDKLGCTAERVFALGAAKR